MDKMQLLEKKLEREKRARETLERLLEDRTRELYLLNEKHVHERDVAQKYLDIAGTMFVVINVDQRVAMINRKGCEVLGCPEKEIVGKNWFDHFIPAKRRDEVKRVFDEIIAGNVEPVEYCENPVLTKSGEERIIAWHNALLRDDGGAVTGTLSSGEDITERKHDERAMQFEKALFEQLFENAPEAIALTDNDSNVLRINKEFTRMFGYTQREALTKPIDELIVPESLRKEGALYTRRTAEGKNIACESIRRRKNGEELYTSILGTPISIDNEQIGVYALYRDITESKKEEKTRAALYNIAKESIHTESLNELFSLIHQSLSEIIDTTNFYIALYDKETDTLSFPYLVDEKDDSLPIVHVSTSLSSASHVINTGKTFLRTKEVYEEKVAAGELKPYGSIAPVWVGVPLKTKENIVGVMVVQSYTDPSAFSEKDIPLLEFVANNIAGVIERTRAQEALDERIKEQNGLFNLGKLIEKAAATAEIWDEFLNTVVPASMQFPEKTCALIELDEKKYYSENGGSMKNSLSSPIVIGKEMRGTLLVGYTEDLPFIAVYEQRLIDGYAERLGRFIERKEAEERFRLLFENAGDGILIADIKTKKLLSANKKMLEMTGYSLEEMLRLSIADIHPGKDILYVAGRIEKQIRGEIALAQDIPVLRKDGSVFLADFNFKPMTIGGTDCLVGMVRDASERKKLEEERLIRGKLEAINNMVVSLNHEMNQPLSVICANTEMLLNSVDPGSEVHADAKIINAEAWKLAQLVKKTQQIKAVKTTEYVQGTEMIDLSEDE